MHGRSVDGYTISVQVKKNVIFSLSHHLAVISNIRLKWARNAPSAKWRLGGPTTTPNPPPLPPHGSSSRRRSMSPAHTHPALSRGRSPPPSSYYTEPPSTTKRYSYNSERSRSRPRSPPFSSSRYEQGQQKYTSAYAYQKSTNSPPPEAKKNSPTTQTSLQQQSTRQSYLHSPPPFL